jgi:hypothetical protein
MMRELSLDVRYALRQIRKAPPIPYTQADLLELAQPAS